MDNTGSNFRSRHVDLLTQQRRLRHLRSIALRNTSARTPDDSAEAGKLDTYFSLHNVKNGTVFYTSEKIKGSLNPTWKSFNLGQLDEKLVNTSQCSFVAKVFRGSGAKYNLIIEWKVNLFGLFYLGKKLQKGEGTYQPNSLIFGLPDGFYGSPLKQVEPVVLEDVSKSLIKVDQASVRDSYSTNSLSRIQTVLRAIKQTQASVDRVRSSIEDELSRSHTLTKKKREREMLTLRVNQMRSDLEWRTMKLQSQKESREQQQAQNHQRDVMLRNKFDTLRKDKGRLHEKKKGYFDVREDLIKTTAQLVMRRKQLILELAHIYPVIELPSGEYTISGVRLPNSEDFSGHDELMIAVALGYTSHLVEMVSCFLNVPLRYTIEHRGSRSQIRDHILDKLTDKDRDFPLYSKGKERFQFSYGVYLLNKNVAQMRFYCGLGTTDLRLTLPNLKSLLQLRLGVKFTNSLLSGHHVSIPPNLGGPQKYNTSFQSLSSSSKDPTRQGNSEKNSVTGRSSSSGDSDKKENNNFEQIASQSKSEQQIVVVNHSIEESGANSIPIKPKNKLALEDELFKGSPDSFFGVESVENVAQRLLDLSQSMERGSSPELDPVKLSGLVFERKAGTDGTSNVQGNEGSRFNSSHIGDPVPINHKMIGSLNHDNEVTSSADESSETSYASNFKVWPTAKDHATIPRTDSSDLLDDYPIEKAVRKSVCDDDYDYSAEDHSTSTFKTCAMTQHRDECGDTSAQVNASSVKSPESENCDGENELSNNDSMATFSLAKSSVIERQVES